MTELCQGRSILRDEQGGVLIPGFFVTAFFVGVLYMLVGGATAMRHGTLLQEGADSAAFSAAEMRAKALNHLAVLNVVKDSTTVTLAVPPSLLDGIEAALEGSDAEAAAEELEALREEAEQAERRASRVGRPLLREADDAQQAIVAALPAQTEELLNRHLLGAIGPPVETIFLAPPPPLPVNPEPIEAQCARIRPEAEAMIEEALENVSDEELASLVRENALEALPEHCEERGLPGMALLESVEQGGDDMQVRAFVAGTELSELGERGVRLASWGAGDEPDAFTNARDELSRLAFAQAESYFDGDATRERALLEPRWEARLRRFRWPRGQSLGADCGRRGGPQRACAQLPSWLERMEWATVH